MLCLVAIGGMGKSSLAWVWLNDDVGVGGRSPQSGSLHGKRPLEGILWWSFYERESSFPKFLDEALRYISAGEIDPQVIASGYDKVRTLYSLLRERRCLVILDGFERELRAYADPSSLYQLDEAIDVDAHARACINPHAATFLRWLASGALGSKILLTTRLFPRDLEGPDGNPFVGCARVDLKVMEINNAVEFFRAQGVTRGTRAAIEAVCEVYGYLPLALRLVPRLKSFVPDTGNIKL